MFPSHEVLILFYVKTTYKTFRESPIFLSSSQPPTGYSTNNIILKRSEDMANKLQLRYVTMVFDEALFAKIEQSSGRMKLSKIVSLCGLVNFT